MFKGLYKIFLSLYFLSGIHFKDKKSSKKSFNSFSINNDTDMVIGNHRGKLWDQARINCAKVTRNQISRLRERRYRYRLKVFKKEKNLVRVKLS